MKLFAYTSGYPNLGALTKAGLDKPSYRIDFTDGMASSAITISTVTLATVDSTNSNVSSVVNSVATTSGAIVTISLLTAGTSGTAAAIDGAQFRIRTTATLSDGKVLIYDNFLIIDNPTYDPTP